VRARRSKWTVNYIFIGARGEVYKSLVLTKFIASRRILIRIDTTFMNLRRTIALVTRLEVGVRQFFEKTVRMKLYSKRVSLVFFV